MIGVFFSNRILSLIINPFFRRAKKNILRKSIVWLGSYLFIVLLFFFSRKCMRRLWVLLENKLSVIETKLKQQKLVRTSELSHTSFLFFQVFFM